MERAQEEMKHLGVFGIYREGHKVMAAHRKIFNEITLAFILPLCFIYLAEMLISEILFSKQPYSIYGKETYSETDFPAYIIFNLAYYTFLVIFSLLSTSAVVYSIACIYANRNISLNKVIGVVPRVWKRLMITFVVIYVFTFCYIVITLASVVTVLEDLRGVKAMNKSRKLIKGKFWVAFTIFMGLNILVAVIQFVFYVFVVYGASWEIWKRVLVGISCLVLIVPIFLYGLVLQTIIYFVCKSYHNEMIDKPSMSNHLGGYERLSDPNEVQMDQV
ncbi:hypothetical protein POM88_022113 [Heracleum sosnowskyi]|uniref:Uncharacterized protein n=1 Tax=Heracleum sosnowskyi TaxID=360622 RepID=A0AAD8MUI2_9APIA|nr:hypothetical protein POM88_022113 [Heracleum sosnowskyi]